MDTLRQQIEHLKLKMAEKIPWADEEYIALYRNRPTFMEE